MTSEQRQSPGERSKSKWPRNLTYARDESSSVLVTPTFIRLISEASVESNNAEDKGNHELSKAWIDVKSRLLFRAAKLKKTHALPVLIGPASIGNRKGEKVERIAFVFTRERGQPYKTAITLDDLNHCEGPDRVSSVLEPFDDVSKYFP